MKPYTIKNQNTFTKDILEEGSYLGRIYQIIHMGTVETYKGSGEYKDQVRFSFELPGELREFSKEKGMQPLSLSADMSISLHEKAKLRALVDACNLKLTTDDEGFLQFNLWDLMGMTCSLSVKVKGDYNNIGGYSKLMKGITVPPAINKLFAYDVNQHDEEKFQKIPQFIREKMEKSPEYAEATKTGIFAEGAVPFEDDEYPTDEELKDFDKF